MPRWRCCRKFREGGAGRWAGARAAPPRIVCASAVVSLNGAEMLFRAIRSTKNNASDVRKLPKASNQPGNRWLSTVFQQPARCLRHCTGSRGYEHSGARKVRPRSEDYADETDERRAVRI